jgi:hypothetical protein
MAQPITATHLSLDLLTRVLHHTFTGEKPSARQQTRYNFALVCKKFSRVVGQDFSLLDVFGTEGMVKAFERLSNPTDRAKVKRVYLQLASTMGKNKGEKFRELMHRVTEVEELEFVVSAKNLDTLERSLVSGLSGLSEMRSLVIRPHKQRELPLLDSSILGV